MSTFVQTTPNWRIQWENPEVPGTVYYLLASASYGEGRNTYKPTMEALKEIGRKNVTISFVAL